MSTRAPWKRRPGPGTRCKAQIGDSESCDGDSDGRLGWTTRIIDADGAQAAAAAAAAEVNGTSCGLPGARARSACSFPRGGGDSDIDSDDRKATRMATRMAGPDDRPGSSPMGRRRTDDSDRFAGPRRSGGRRARRLLPLDRPSPPPVAVVAGLGLPPRRGSATAGGSISCTPPRGCRPPAPGRVRRSGENARRRLG